MFEQTLEVLPNDICGVSGGYEVPVLWCVDGLANAFYDALPSDTQEKLKPHLPRVVADFLKSDLVQFTELLLDKKDIDALFPFDTTFYGEYSTRLVRLLAESAAYNLVHGGGEVLWDFFSQ